MVRAGAVSFPSELSSLARSVPASGAVQSPPGVTCGYWRRPRFSLRGRSPQPDASFWKPVGGQIAQRDFSTNKAGRYHSRMKTFDRKAKMDEMETLDYQGWHFLCSGEQLPSGVFQATVRYKSPPDGQIRTLVLDPEQHDSASQALDHAKKLAMNWAHERGGDGRGNS